MTKKFQKIETVICSIEVKDWDTGGYVEPTSMTIMIKAEGPPQKVTVGEVAMGNDSLGKYHYDFNANSGDPCGIYKIRYKAVLNDRTTVEDQEFELVI